MVYRQKPIVVDIVRGWILANITPTGYVSRIIRVGMILGPFFDLFVAAKHWYALDQWIVATAFRAMQLFPFYIQCAATYGTAQRLKMTSAHFILQNNGKPERKSYSDLGLVELIV